MRSHATNASLLVLLTALSAAAADNPFIGTWKFNPEKSKLTGDTMTITSVAGGMMRFSAFGISYNFKADGQERPGPFDRTVVCKQLDDHTWELTFKVGGKELETDTWAVSSDGKTLNAEFKGTKPNGDNFDDKATFERVSGQGTGLEGKWIDKHAQVSAPGTLEIKAEGDGLTFTDLGFKSTFSSKLDGEDVPLAGPTVPADSTVSATRSGARSIKTVVKVKGKPMFLDTYTVSADGKTLTDVGRPVAVNEPATFVYEKQ